MNTFSIIIPVKPGGYVAACDHLKKIISPHLHCEIILAEGRSPSQQRNRAALAATGDILYFLDDDSLVTTDCFTLCSAAMSDSAVAVVGGPSLTPSDDSWLQQLFGFALSSLLGSGPVRNRYRTYGEARATTDKELILCNFAVRRSVFMDLGGFNECLYPNEENEFLERVMLSGHTLLHVPSMYVVRSQRRTLKAFILQMFNYGRGRAQQTLITSTFPIVSFIPLFFVIYLILAAIFTKYTLLLVPLVVYVSSVLVISLIAGLRTRRFYAVLLLFIYPLMHIVNGLGLLWGLINGTPKPVHDNVIQIKRLKMFGELFSQSNNEIVG